MKITLAIQITLLRILLTPIIVWFVQTQQWIMALILFVCAVLTDFFDGFVARRYKQESRMGQLLDPIADKTLIIALMYTLFLQKSIGLNLDSGLEPLGYFFIGKEIILLAAAAVLYMRYDLFFKPTLFSRFVSVSEMFIIFEILLCRALIDGCYDGTLSVSGNMVWIVGFICGLHIMATVFLSIILLLHYVVKIVCFLWKKQ